MYRQHPSQLVLVQVGGGGQVDGGGGGEHDGDEAEVVDGVGCSIVG